MVCILLSTYNGELYLDEQLESLIRQEGVDIHILVRDDGSKDTTGDIVRRWQTTHPSIIDFVQGENVGFAMSFTHLLQEAVNRYPTVEYFAFCDQDDVWLPKKMQKNVKKLEKEAKDIPVAYCSNTCLVDSNLRFMRMGWKKGEAHLTKERALIQSFAIGCTMVFNRRAVDVYVSHLPEVIKVHDFLMYQLCMFLGKVIYDENSYILYRQHGNNQIGKPGFWKRWQRRWASGNYKKHTLELQNYRFLKAYKDLLSVDDIGLISQIAFYQRSLFTKLALLFNCKIRYTRLGNNFFYMLKIIIGGGKTAVSFQSGDHVCFRCYEIA